MQSLGYYSAFCQYSLIELLIVGINENLHRAMLFIFMHSDVDGIAAVAAVFNIILIFTASVDSDVSRVTTEWA